LGFRLKASGFRRNGQRPLEPWGLKNTADVFLAIRRARNNLAHGAKYHDRGAGHADFVERDDALLGQSLAVMTLL